MRHVSLLNSSWQIQQVRLSTWLKLFSVKEANKLDSLLPRVVDGSWCFLSFRCWSCCLSFNELSAACFSSCRLQFDDWLKNILQCLHENGLTPVWVRSCCLQADVWVKPFLQCWHVYGFSPVWVRSCCLQCDETVKDFLQCLHEYGFTPVWVRSCCLQFPKWLKPF